MFIILFSKRKQESLRNNVCDCLILVPSKTHPPQIRNRLSLSGSLPQTVGWFPESCIIGKTFPSPLALCLPAPISFSSALPSQSYRLQSGVKERKGKRKGQRKRSLENASISSEVIPCNYEGIIGIVPFKILLINVRSIFLVITVIVAIFHAKTSWNAAAVPWAASGRAKIL